MRRYPSRTIYRYLDLPPTQIIQTHNSHRHNTTHTTATQTRTHVQHFPVPTGLVNKNPILLSTHPLSTHTVPSQTHTHLTYSTNSSYPMHHTHPQHVSFARHNTEPRVPPTCSALTTTTSITHTSIVITLALQHSLSILISNTNNSTRIIHRNHRTHHIGNFTDRPMTNTWLHTPHKHGVHTLCGGGGGDTIHIKIICF